MTLLEQLAVARTIKNATGPEENTRVRLGGLFEEIINYMSSMLISTVSPYQVYLDTTEDDPVMTVEEWLASLEGTDGRGIVSIILTNTVGLIKTYTITYTDETTSTFDVTNGSNGQPGANGRGITSITLTNTVDLVDTYTITFTDNSTTTFDIVNGANGTDGDSLWEQSPDLPKVSNGRLYNWHAVNDSRKLAPEGWHVLTANEWTALVNYLVGSIPFPEANGVVAIKLREEGYFNWIKDVPETRATNESGFSILPSGIKDSNGLRLMGEYSYLWASDLDESSHCSALITCYNNFSNGLTNLGDAKHLGLSVRCIIDEDNQGYTTGDDVVDIDGNVYTVIQIGTQILLAQNLAVTHYNNGDPILQDFSGTVGAYANYDDSEVGVFEEIIEPIDKKRLQQKSIIGLESLANSISKVKSDMSSKVTKIPKMGLADIPSFIIGFTNPDFISTGVAMPVTAEGWNAFFNTTEIVEVSFDVSLDDSYEGVRVEFFANHQFPLGTDLMYNENINYFNSRTLISNVTTNAFANCPNLVTVEFGSALTNIGGSAFSDTGIIDISIPANVNVETGAFINCLSLSTVEAKKGVIFNTNTFDTCTGLAYVILETNTHLGVDTQANYNFANCASLGSITVPDYLRTCNNGAIHSDIAYLIETYNTQITWTKDINFDIQAELSQIPPLKAEVEGKMNKLSNGAAENINQVTIETLCSLGFYFENATFSSANFINAPFNGAQFRKVNFEYAILTNCTLVHADLSFCSFWSTASYACDMGFANFTGSDLSNAVFDGCYLSDVNFTDTIITGVDWNNSVFTTAIGLNLDITIALADAYLYDGLSVTWIDGLLYSYTGLDGWQLV